MTDRHEHLDEGTIHAWLDGALPPDESAKVESLAAACAECAALVAEARGLVAASSRILSSLDAVPGGVIPGIDAGADQLAALRARRRETSRRWWNDRRIVAAASLVFVAGAASLVWRSTSTEVTSAVEQLADAAQPTADSAAPVAAAPASPPVAAREAPARDAKVAASAPRESAREVVTVPRVLDSTADLKATPPAASLARGAAAVANESRRADSIGRPRQLLDSARVASSTVQRLAAESQVQQQGGAAQKQQSFRQRAEQAQRAAPPSALGVGARLGSVVTTGVSAAAPADMAGVAGSCYRLRWSASPSRQDTIVVDSVQLLGETVPESSDPTWYRARAAGWATDTALVWRSVDATTVELRSRVTANPLVVRFSTTASGLPLPDLGREAGVRAALPLRIGCP